MKLKLLVILLILNVLTSCSRIPGKLRIMEANFYNSRGRYSEAAAAYLKALEDEDAAPYAGYGLGTMYYSLDEEQAALERFAASQKNIERRPPGEYRELLCRLHYNTGIALFSEGDFSGAAVSFREALRIDPGRIGAKRNLELSLLSIARENAAKGENGQLQDEGESRTVLFDYLREREQSRWKSIEWTAEEQNTEPDY